MTPRLQEKYTNEVIQAMTEKFGYKNIMEVPKLEKIVINMGVGEAKDNQKVLESAVADLQLISGQKPILTRAKKSVANFKIRENMALGCKVTLRGAKMFDLSANMGWHIYLAEYLWPKYSHGESKLRKVPVY